MLLDLCFAIVFFTLSLEGPEPNAVKGFGLETMRYGKRLPPTVGVGLSHKVTLGDSHGREPVVCNKSDGKSRKDDRRVISRCCLSSLQD